MNNLASSKFLTGASRGNGVGRAGIKGDTKKFEQEDAKGTEKRGKCSP
jgi:hypothetical protein